MICTSEEARTKICPIDKGSVPCYGSDCMAWTTKENLWKNENGDAVFMGYCGLIYKENE